MRGSFEASILVVGAVAALGYGAVVNAATPRCRVEGAANLPSGRGPRDLCAQIERAIAVASPHAQYVVTVKVLSSSRLVAFPTVNGRILPEQNFAIMDHELDAGAIRRFAEALAVEVAKAAKE